MTQTKKGFCPKTESLAFLVTPVEVESTLPAYRARPPSITGVVTRVRGHELRVMLDATNQARPGVSFPLALHFPECVAGVY